MLAISIQAGGQSKRMGQNKALMSFQGIPLIQRIKNRVTPAAEEIIVIANEAADYHFLELPVYPDQIPGSGVIGGLLTSFYRITKPFVAPIGCDLPFISTLLLEEELRIILESGADIVIPQSEKGLEPLCAIYRKDTCLPWIEKAISRGDRRIVSWFGQVKVKVLSPPEVQQIDPNPYIFLNINNPEDFKQALELAA
ncbi:MAG: molybdenum cofactor guanylyltransferase [Chloroflexi bacterium]|nr:molybdenum cofactor guanylyltransferase [Chloroflexota bacterium]